MDDSQDPLIYGVELSRELDPSLLLLLAPSSPIHPEEKRLVHTSMLTSIFTEPYRISSLTNVQQENSSTGVETSETKKPPHNTAQHSTAQNY
ncbi:hypothetical protein BTUL_0031g00010 [Botrytis tulipae]|uniref:Uncharacterized protein n=1 Tax=Botrytis tulipae TaxID=87230 RepID=A0A4Z1EVH4_9HELO|nr:hypothetical protein BTUL_0031g00010 [Botrytis tulipae]